MGRNVSMVFFLPVLLLCLVTLGAGRPSTEKAAHITLGNLKIKLFPFPHLSHDDEDTRRRVGFFVDNPLISVKRSFQDIQTNVERSMQSLLAAGSAIGQRMLGMITRSPRLLVTPHHHQVTVRPAHIQHGENFPDFKNCDCHFGVEAPAQFQPYTELESYGAPAAPLLSQPTPASPLPDPGVDLAEEVYDNTIDGEPIIEAEPVIHPGGSQDVDYQKVQTIGVASVVQAASAKVPDQNHPEKYLNHDHSLLVSVVEHNLWRKQTKEFKHHPEKHGQKLKVIPHLVRGDGPLISSQGRTN